METIRTHQYVFVSEALAQLFHRTPRDFFKYLHQDGNIFLRFYWDRVGKELKLPRQPAPAELTYEIRQPIPSTLVALVILPQPRIEKEAYFAAMIYRPHRVTPFLRISDTTKMLVLEYRLNREGQPITVLIEWSKRQKYLLIGRGPEPELEAFYGAVLEQL
jgi:hypothetical protein